MKINDFADENCETTELSTRRLIARDAALASHFCIREIVIPKERVFSAALPR
jgi:hypothetical protein